VEDFISEDDLKTFDGWLKYQTIDPATTSPDELTEWRRMFDETMARCAASPKVGLMKLQSVQGEHRYAVAVREGSLWLVMWVRCSRKGEFFVILPTIDRCWDLHTTYHLDGKLHTKSHGQKEFSRQEQPLTGSFSGSVCLGTFAGFAPKGVGAICDPAAFSGIVEVAPSQLGPGHGQVTIDLLGPGAEPPPFSWTNIARRRIFQDTIPSVAITVGYCH
jgi:hypothetical protein